MRSIKIFCSYASDSAKDRNLVKRLTMHLDNLERQIQISVWHVHKIAAGLDLKQEINRNLRSANIILLCISPDYMNSSSCLRQAQRAVQLEQSGSAIVRVIPLRHIYWKDTVFRYCEALPKSGKFISKWPDKDEVFDEVAQNVKELVQELRDNQTVQEFNRTNLGSLSETHTFTRTATPPVMPSIEELRTNGQTGEVVVSRQTEDFRIDKKTEDLKQKKPTVRRRNQQAFAAKATTSQEKKPLPKPRRRKYPMRTSDGLSSEDARRWLWQVRQEYRYITHGKQGIFWSIVFGCDVLCMPVLIWNWSNSLGLSGLVFSISLLTFIGGTINIDGLAALLPSLLYLAFWSAIFYHFTSLHSSINLRNASIYPLIISGIIIVFLIHFLLFRRHHR